MDPFLVLLLLGVICMAAMAPMMLFGGHRHWMGWDPDHRSRFSDRPESARHILDRRYASGEITKDSYQAMLVDLEPRTGAE